MYRQLSIIDHVINGIVLILGLAIGSLAISIICIINHNNIQVLLLLNAISSFLLVVWLLIRLLPFNLLLKLIIDTLLKLFFIILSIVYLVLEDNSIRGAKHPSSLKQAFAIMSIIQMVLIVITLSIELIMYKYGQTHFHDLEADIEKDSQFSYNTQVGSICPSKTSGNSNINHQISCSSSSKTKHSLAGGSSNDPENKSTPLSPTFPFTKSHSKNSSIDYNNWMNVNPKQIDLDTTYTATPKESSKIPLYSRSVPNFQLKLGRQCFEYDADGGYPLPNDDSIQNFDLMENYDNNSNRKIKTETDLNTKLNGGQIPRDNKSHETLIPNCNSDNSLHQNLDTHDLKRSKSTTVIPSKNIINSDLDNKNLRNIKASKRQERWKSINDEKTFLKNINECLLPSVLKKGESPILALKRKQQSQDFDSASDKTIYNVEEINYNKSYTYNDLYDIQPTKKDLAMKEGNEDVKEDEDSNSINLPYISEFDDGLANNQNDDWELDQEQDLFKDFDQEEYENTVSEFKIPKSMNHEKQWIPHNNSTKSLNHISLNEWNENSQAYQNFRSRSGANLNIPGISRLVSDHRLNDSNLTLTNDKIDYENLLLPPLEQRADNIDNLSDLYSDQNSPTYSCANYDLDNNSDLELENIETTNKQPDLESVVLRPVFNHLNRSFSAPSLQTFRNVSNHSHKSHSTSNTEANAEEILRYNTPPPLEPNNETSKSSPIKKLYSSPKRLFRRSIESDLGTFKETSNSLRHHNHHHTSSIMSSQFSLYSSPSKTSPKRNSSKKSQLANTSNGINNNSNNLYRSISPLNSNLPIRSKSLSPKKSIKSFINSRRLFQSQTKINDSQSPIIIPPPPTLLKQAIVKYPPQHSEDQYRFWDLQTSKSSDNSRISSLPSAVIGEYDREKWNTLKELNNV